MNSNIDEYTRLTCTNQDCKKKYKTKTFNPSKIYYCKKCGNILLVNQPQKPAIQTTPIAEKPTILQPDFTDKYGDFLDEYFDYQFNEWLTNSKVYNEDAVQTRPYVRYIARTIDMYIYLIIIHILLVLQFGMAKNNLYSFITVLAFPFVEACSFELFGTTFGKWLLKIEVRKLPGYKLTYTEALKRGYRVLAFGYFFFVPIISVGALVMAFERLKNTGFTSWDQKDFNFVVHGKTGIFRWIIVLALFFSPYIFNSLI